MKKVQAALLVFLMMTMSLLAVNFRGDGNDGDNGIDGTNGIDGDNGIDGADGLNTLITTISESPGLNCNNGGTKIVVGLDVDRDGFLSEAEIEQTEFICDGGSSASTLLTTYSIPPSSLGCDGGSVISHGLDNGDDGGTIANGQLESGEVDSSTTFCTSYNGYASLVENINTDTQSSYFSDPTVFNNQLYFEATNGISGTELWTYDGTNPPSMVADIRSGSSSSSPSDLTVFNNQLYFRADDGISGSELWTYDGTNPPSMVADIGSGSSSSSPDVLTVFNNQLYFSASDGYNDSGLWSFRAPGDFIFYS